jgi:hypothetical protein
MRLLAARVYFLLAEFSLFYKLLFSVGQKAQSTKERADREGWRGELPLPGAPLELRHERHVVGRPLRVGQASVLGARLRLGVAVQVACESKGLETRISLDRCKG